MDNAKKILKDFYPFILVLYVVQALIFFGNIEFGTIVTFGIYTFITLLFGILYFTAYLTSATTWLIKKITQISVIAYVKITGIIILAGVLLSFTTIDIVSFCAVLYASIAFLFAVSSRKTAVLAFFFIILATVLVIFDPNALISNGSAILGFELLCIAGISQLLTQVVNRKLSPLHTS